MVRDCFYSDDAGNCDLYTGGVRDDLCIEDGKCVCQQDPAPSCTHYADLIVAGIMEEML